MRAQGDHANNNSTTVETEMDEMLVDWGHTAATTLTSDVVHPPPSYNSIKGKVILWSFIRPFKSCLVCPSQLYKIYHLTLNFSFWEI